MLTSEIHLLWKPGNVRDVGVLGCGYFFLDVRKFKFLDKSNTVQTNPSMPFFDTTNTTCQSAATADIMTLQVMLGCSNMFGSCCSSTLCMLSLQNSVVSTVWAIFCLILFDHAAIWRWFLKAIVHWTSSNPVKGYKKCILLSHKQSTMQYVELWT
jgi:hypothetical protein